MLHHEIAKSSCDRLKEVYKIRHPKIKDNGMIEVYNRLNNFKSNIGLTEQLETITYQNFIH